MGSIFNKLVEHGGYAIWYGAWVLLGITLGLLLHAPLTAEAYVEDTITGVTSGLITVTDGTYYNSLSTYGRAATIEYKNYTDFSLESVDMIVCQKEAYTVDVWLEVYASSSGLTLVGTSDNLSSPLEVVTGTTACNYASSTVTFTFSIQPDLVSGTEYVFLVNTNPNTKTIVGTTDYFIKWNYMLNGTSPGATSSLFAIGRVRPNNVNTTPWTGWSDSASDSYFVEYNGLYVPAVRLSAGATFSYDSNGIVDVSPDSDSYGNATSGYITAGSVVLSEWANIYDDFEIGISCNYYNNALPEIAGAYNDSIYTNAYYSDASCNYDTICYPTGISWPDSLVADSQYNCTATLYGVYDWWIDTTLDTDTWTFYTFNSTSSPSWREYASSSSFAQGNPNLTGTSTSEIFGDCNIFTGDVMPCFVEPVRFMLVPSQQDIDDTKANVEGLLADKFPFSYITAFNGAVQEPILLSSTTEEVFPDVALDFTDFNGATVTLTILDGGTFSQSWTDIEEFATVRTAIYYTLVFGFAYFYIFKRARRLVPSSEAIKE